MKLKSIIMPVIALAISIPAMAASKTENIKVSGNCGQCKKHIEEAAKLPGVEKATWDKKSKVLSVTYDPQKINTDRVQMNVANAGYDTEKFKAPNEAYEKLDECCQYDRAK